MCIHICMHTYTLNHIYTHAHIKIHIRVRALIYTSTNTHSYIHKHTHCLSWVSTDVIKHYDQKQPEREEFAPAYTSKPQFCHRKSRKESTGRNCSRTHGGGVFTGLLSKACSAWFLTYQDYLHRCGTNHRLGPVNCHNQGKEGNALQTCLYASPIGAFSQQNFFLPRWPYVVWSWH